LVEKKIFLREDQVEEIEKLSKQLDWPFSKTIRKLLDECLKEKEAKENEQA